MTFAKQTTLIATLIAALAAGSTAQEDPAQQKKQQQPEQPQIMSLEFEGGSLAEFIALVREGDKAINIVASGLADEVQLPAITLRKTTVHAALRAVSNIVPQDYQVGIDDLQDRTGHPVYAVSVRTRPGNPGTGATSVTASSRGRERLMVQVYSLRGLTRNLPTDPEGTELIMKPETVLMAVDTGLAVGAPKTKAGLKYHADSGLLFVHGTNDQVRLVQEVLRSLQQDLERARQAAQMKQSMQARSAGAKKSSPERSGAAKSSR